jgi:hypothetical protein
MNKVPGHYSQTPVFFIGRADFIANKKGDRQKKRRRRPRIPGRAIALAPELRTVFAMALS